MINFTTLKHQQDGTPTWDSFLGIILIVAQRKEQWHSNDLIQSVLAEIDMPENIRNMRYTSKYHDLIMPNRVGWALSDLAISGLLDRPRRGIYRITERDCQISESYGLNVPRMIVHSEPAYLKHQEEKKTQNKLGKSEEEQKTFVSNPQQIKDGFNRQLEKTQDDLLRQLVQMNPYKFESLMVKLLSVMGYKGDDGQALVTQKSNDHGIDGIINQDPLGLQKVYLQVKRYALNNSVKVSEIMAFSGAIKLRHADRGVFITTSSFTQGAINAAKDLNITLVNGEMLTNLMIQYKIGVEVQIQYNLYRVDRDIFIE